MQDVTVYSVTVDSCGEVGTQVWQFTRRESAENFARVSTCYGQPAKVVEDTLPAHIAKRRGLGGKSNTSWCSLS